MNIKPNKINTIKFEYLVKIEVECTEPESFPNQEEFNKEDGGDMKHYLKLRMLNTLTECWQNAARVKKVKVKKI